MVTGFITPPQRKRTASTSASTGVTATNTRSSLWPERWPAIALQECIDKVEAAPPSQQPEVKLALPCGSCSESARCLTAKRKEIGPLMYSRELQTQPRTSDSSLFPRELFQPCLHDGLSLTPFYHKPFSLEHHFVVVQAWDLAWSEKIGGDWLVNMTGVVDLRDGTRQLVDIQRWQQISFDDQVKLIDSRWKQFGADLVVIEADAAQQVWTKHVGRNTAVPVLAHTSGDKTSLAHGVPSLLIQLSNRKWVFPYKRESYHHDEMEVFLTEAESFSWVDGKLQGVGEHDDTVMCWWHLSWGMDRFVQQEAGREYRRGTQDGKA